MNRKLSITLVGVAGGLPLLWIALGGGNLPPVQASEAVRATPLLGQTIVVISAFMLKPLYMLGSLLLIWLVRRARAPDLTALRWGLWAFLIGETWCAINFLFFQEKSYLAEYLHNFGMVVSFAFIVYALLDGLDRRVLQYSRPHKRCALIGLCGACVKTNDVPCRVRQLFQLACLALTLLVFIPLISATNAISYNTLIYGTPYQFMVLRIHQLFEIRYCPLWALGMFILALLTTLRSPEKQVPTRARIFFAAGTGALGFSIFRLIFQSIYVQNLAWATSWEEITEFLLISIVAYVLWLFRRRLGISFALIIIRLP